MLKKYYVTVMIYDICMMRIAMSGSMERYDMTYVCNMIDMI